MRKAVLILGCIALGCAGGLRLAGSGDEARFRHSELGYEVAHPSVLGDPGWATVEIEEADLVVRHRDGSQWALASTCRVTRASPRILAAELARATGGRPTGTGSPVEHAGLPGWTQLLERDEGGRRLQVRTVTLRGPRCTYDWILIAPDPARRAALEPAFEAWWRSFVPGRIDRPGEGDAT